MDQDGSRVRTQHSSHCLLSALMAPSGGVMCIGGPALVWYVTPTEEELFKVSYHPWNIPLG